MQMSLDFEEIFYTSDNGFHLGEHRLWSGKREPYEEDIRVPLIVRGPNVPQNATVFINAQSIFMSLNCIANISTSDFPMTEVRYRLGANFS
jgi:hypothetical protein